MGETSATLTLPSTLATWDRGPLTCGSPSFLAAPAAGPSFLFFFLFFGPAPFAFCGSLL